MRLRIQNRIRFFPIVRCSDRHYCRMSKASDMSMALWVPMADPVLSK